VHVDDDLRDHPDSLLERAIRDEISPSDQTELDWHLAQCPECAAELEAARMLRASMAPGAEDAALNHVAVELALARIQDEALNQSAVEKALHRLNDRESFGERLRDLLGSWRWLQPAGSAAMGAVLVLVVTFATARLMRRPESLVAHAPSSRTLTLEDGSTVTPFDGRATIQLSEQGPVRTVVRLQSGAAQFRIRHNGQRLFRVDAGEFEIEDLGTLFGVEHQAEGKIRVKVTEGRVAVSHAASQLWVELGAGDDRVFSPAAALANTPEPPREAPIPEASKETPPASASSPGARVLSGSHALDVPADLLASADQARRAGHPQSAVAPLRRLLKHYPKDPRAPSAAFTLGWLLLTDLGRAREAAEAFAETERIAPRGALAEDATARVAEAWQKAGNGRRAAEAARRYQQLYPNGRYAGLMRGMLDEK
jgi:transmembrane sensor